MVHKSIQSIVEEFEEWVDGITPTVNLPLSLCSLNYVEIDYQPTSTVQNMTPNRGLPQR